MTTRARRDTTLHGIAASRVDAVTAATDRTRTETTPQERPSPDPWPPASPSSKEQLPRSVDPVFVPESEVDYSIRLRIGSEHVAFAARFSPAFIEYARREGLGVNLWSGDILKSAEPLETPIRRTRYEYEIETGKNEPGWLFFEPMSRQYGLPNGRVDVDFQDGSIVWRCQDGIIDGHQYLIDEQIPMEARYDTSPGVNENPRVHENPSVHKSRRDLQPMRRVESPLDHEIAVDGATIRANTRRLALRARDRFDSVCGGAVEAWRARRESTEIELERLRKILGAGGGGGGEGGGGEALNSARSSADLRARLSELEAKMIDAEIIVVPAGRHFLALPMMEPLRDTTFAEAWKSLEAGTLTIVSKDGSIERLVFLLEEDLENADGDEAETSGASEHELTHLVEDHYLSSEDRAAIDLAHADAIARGAVFPRPYGRPRAEFLTTLSEVFRGGVHLDPDPEWVRNHHPVVYEVLNRARGRTRATTES